MKVNKQAIENWLEGNGFKRMVVCKSTNEYLYVDGNGINIWINWDSGIFKFAWRIPHTFFKILSGDMTPVYRIDHLDKMYTKFLREVRSHGE